MIKRSELVQGIAGRIVADSRFRVLRGLTLGELKDVINLVLDARRDVGNELQRRPVADRSPTEST
jgi:hypothetical protein